MLVLHIEMKSRGGTWDLWVTWNIGGHADVRRSAEYLRRKSMDSAEQAGELILYSMIHHDTI